MIENIKVKFKDGSEIIMKKTDEGWLTMEDIEDKIKNAKMALEEAFTPHLKRLLSKKLKEDNDG